MNKTSSSFIMLVFLVFSIFAISGRLQAEPLEAWNRVYDGGSGEYTNGVVVDRQGNVVVTGATDDGSNADYLTIKYDTDGNVLWTRVYDRGPYDYAYGVAVDRQGNVVVTGWSYNIGSLRDYLTIKYDPDGNELWTSISDGGSYDWAFGVAVDRYGNVVVTGSSYNGSNEDSLTIKYAEDVAIDAIWTSDLLNNPKRRFRPGDDIRVHVEFTVRGAATTAYDIKALGRAFVVTGTFWEKRLDGQTLSSQAPGSYALTWDKKVPSTATSGSDARIELSIKAEALDAIPYKLVPAKGKKGFKVR